MVLDILEEEEKRKEFRKTSRHAIFDSQGAR